MKFPHKFPLYVQMIFMTRKQERENKSATEGRKFTTTICATIALHTAIFSSRQDCFQSRVSPGSFTFIFLILSLSKLIFFVHRFQSFWWYYQELVMVIVMQRFSSLFFIKSPLLYYYSIHKRSKLTISITALLESALVKN